jgi:polysaccharide pyruvyl transferase WcaK-like protein
VRRVLLRGYYGFQNSGDDALLAASAFGVRRAYGTPISVAALASTIPEFPGSDSVGAAMPLAPRVRGEGRARLLWEAIRCDAVAFGGGSVFHARAGLERFEPMLRIAGRGPHLAAGVSIGPFRAATEERTCARILRRLAFIGLRDAESAQVAKALAPAVESKLTFDLAPLLKVLDDAPAHVEQRRGIGLALCDHERFTNGDMRCEAARRARVHELLRILDRDLVDEIVLVDFNGHPERGDARLHSEIELMARALGFRTRHIPYEAKPLAVLRTISRLRAVLAMRLHAAVFGYLTQTPTIVLSYHPKCLGWAQQVGVADRLVHDSVEFDPRGLADTVARVLRGDHPEPSLPITAAVERALLNFPRMT